MREKRNRSYKLLLLGNKVKTDTALYTLSRSKLYFNSFIGRVYFGEKRISTAGMGDVASRALYKAMNMVRSLRALEKIGNKTNVPYAPNIGCRAELRKSNNTFDYWIRLPNMFTRTKVVWLPAKSHRALNRALREGWKLSNVCEFKIINGNPYAVVFVSKESPRDFIPKNILGCDVGLKHSVVCSDGYLGHGLRRVIKNDKRKTAERRRQGHKVSSKVKTVIKQLLDREAKKVLRRSQLSCAGIAVENPKRLANLRSGKLQGWARSYFANRLHILGAENGVMVVDVNPYQTSQTCSKCGVADKESRVTRDAFCCTSCGFAEHADKNAAVVIAQKGTQMLLKRSDQNGKISGSRERVTP
jgi:transposase